EVVARCDCRVSGAELFAEFGVALDADAERGVVEIAEREYLGAGFEDGEFGAERELLARAGEVEAEGVELAGGHASGCSRPVSSSLSRASRLFCWLGVSVHRRFCSLTRWVSRALSVIFLPRRVSLTRVPRRSPGSGRRSTRPASARR